MEKQRAKIIGIARHRLSTDGDGVTTLVAFHCCPLSCRYCLNPQSLGDGGRFREYSPRNCMPKRASTSFISSPQTVVLPSVAASLACVRSLYASFANCVALHGSSILRRRSTCPRPTSRLCSRWSIPLLSTSRI